MPSSIKLHPAREVHLSSRAGWLRAGVLGANDGLISTAALVVGVAAAGSGRSTILLAGISGLTAGALSMAAGEYISVSSQRDTERADLARELHELSTDPASELDELTDIYRARGLSDDLARQVATQLSEGDQLRVHARDELGLDVDVLANPLQASVVSALSFAIGALLPVLLVALVPSALRIGATVGLTLVGLAALGSVSAALGGAPRGRAAGRVVIGGALALAISLAVGAVTGAAI